MNLRLSISKILIWISAVCFSLMAGGNLYEQIVLVRYFDDDLPRTLWFWQDILKSGTFDFYLLAPVCIVATLLSFIFSWNYRKVRWLMLVSFLSLVVNTLITFVPIMPHLETLFFPIDKPNDRPVEQLLKAHKAFTNLSILRWVESFAGLICTFVALNIISSLKQQDKPEPQTQKNKSQQSILIPEV
jgi:hypothetical protein